MLSRIIDYVASFVKYYAEGRKSCITNAERIVTIGGAVTEIVFGLGAGSQVVGIDLSSTHPPEATELPIIGYQRRITAEGVMSANPTLVIATTEAEPIASFRLIRDTGSTVLILPEVFTLEGTHDKIRKLGTALGREEESERLIQQIEVDLKTAESFVAKVTTKPRVLFVYARGGAVLLVGGRDTQAASMIELSGAENAGGNFRGFQPLTAEAVVAANPQILLMLTGGFESIGGMDRVLELPGIALTDAGRDRNIIHFDDNYLLGFGPRYGKAVLDLAEQLHR